ncbi:MAG: hypothetical protein WBX03_12005 [Terriglobales bacterium]|jgi:hypothetical protein
MPEWIALVRERIGSLGITSAQEEETIAELASHLEDLYEDGRANGLCESEAIRLVLEQVTDWHKLRRKIQSAKHKRGVMNYRTRTFWLPALISLASAMVSLMISTQVSLQPRFVARGFVTVHTSTASTSIPLVAYLPWLTLLPFCGAAGAYLSRRGGGQCLARLVVGLFPWIALFSLVSLLTVVGQIVPFQHQWLDFVTVLLLVSVPPGIALFLGVIPFLKDSGSARLAND